MALKSFRDRNPYTIGIASVVVLLVATAGAFSIGLFHALHSTATEVTALPLDSWSDAGAPATARALEALSLLLASTVTPGVFLLASGVVG